MLLGDALLADWRKWTARGAARVRAYYDVHPDPSSALTLDPAARNKWGDPLPKIEHRIDTASRDREQTTRDQILDRFRQLARARTEPC